MISNSYRTVVLLLEPDEEQERILKENEVAVQKFLGMSKSEMSKLLYHGFDGKYPSSRTLSLMTQRIVNMPKTKAIIPFDDHNSRFVEENGLWYVELQAEKGRKPRLRIPVAKSRNRYYDVLDEVKNFSFYITHENDKWFAYISLPSPSKSNSRVVGIDFNVNKWVASRESGRPLFFDARPYNREIERIEKLISRRQKRGEDTEELYRKRGAVVKRAHGNFLSAIEQKFCNGEIPTLAVENVEIMYKLIEKDSSKINNWLNTKTTLHQFILRAEAKGFEVVQINPRGTTSRCHRCGSSVKKHGKKERLIDCECGLRNYNRDLNASRNIAIRGRRYLSRGGEFVFGKCWNKMEKKVKS